VGRRRISDAVQKAQKQAIKQSETRRAARVNVMGVGQGVSRWRFVLVSKKIPETLVPTVDSCRPGRQGCEWWTFQGLEPLSRGQGQSGSSIRFMSTSCSLLTRTLDSRGVIAATNNCKQASLSGLMLATDSPDCSSLTTCLGA
jgi:hypothetical protein